MKRLRKQQGKQVSQKQLSVFPALLSSLKQARDISQGLVAPVFNEKRPWVLMFGSPRDIEDSFNEDLSVSFYPNQEIFSPPELIFSLAQPIIDDFYTCEPEGSVWIRHEHQHYVDSCGDRADLLCFPTENLENTQLCQRLFDENEGCSSFADFFHPSNFVK